MKIEPNIPLADKVAESLRKRIREDYRDGGQIPGEIELGEDLGVSRGTIRQALSILEGEGVIVRKQGSGTYANPHVLQVKVRAEFAYEISEILEQSGFKATIGPVVWEQIPASDQVAEKLWIFPGSPVLKVSKTFFADQEPAVFLIDYIPYARILKPFGQVDLDGSIYAFLENICNLRVEYLLSEFIPQLPDEEIAQILHTGVDQAVLRGDEISYNRENEIFMFSTIYYRDDMIRFTVLRKSRL
jgi:GntR family transcriptional regulator